MFSVKFYFDLFFGSFCILKWSVKVHSGQIKKKTNFHCLELAVAPRQINVNVEFFPMGQITFSKFYREFEMPG